MKVKERLYPFQYDKIFLPISHDIEAHLDIREESIAVTRASTGAGKTTLFPFLVAEAGRLLLSRNSIAVIYLFCGTVPVVEQTFEKLEKALKDIREYSGAESIIFVGRGQEMTNLPWLKVMGSDEFQNAVQLNLVPSRTLIIYQTTTHHLQNVEDFQAFNRYPSVLFLDEIHFGGTSDPSLLLMNTGHDNPRAQCIWQKQIRSIKYQSAYGFTATPLQEMVKDRFLTYRMLSEVEKEYTIDRNKLASNVYGFERIRAKRRQDQFLHRKIVKSTNELYRRHGIRVPAFTNSVDPMTEYLVLNTVLRNNKLLKVSRELGVPFRKCVGLLFAGSDKLTDETSTHNIAKDIIKVLAKLEKAGIYTPAAYGGEPKGRVVIYKSEFKGFIDDTGHEIQPGWHTGPSPTSKLEAALSKRDGLMFVVALRSLRLGFSVDNINSIAIYGDCKNDEFITTTVEQILGRANRFNIPNHNNWTDFMVWAADNPKWVKYGLLSNTFDIFHSGSPYVLNGIEKYFERQILEQTKTRSYLRELYRRARAIPPIPMKEAA